jgi:Tol biopolymer transport system component
MAVMSNGGDELRVLRDLPAHYGRFRWTSDSERLTYADKEARKGNIWIQPLNSDPPSQLTHWANNPIFFFDWSRDGKLLAYANGTMTSDVVLISDVR